MGSFLRGSSRSFLQIWQGACIVTDPTGKPQCLMTVTSQLTNGGLVHAWCCHGAATVAAEQNLPRITGTAQVHCLPSALTHMAQHLQSQASLAPAVQPRHRAFFAHLNSQFSFKYGVWTKGRRDCATPGKSACCKRISSALELIERSQPSTSHSLRSSLEVTSVSDAYANSLSLASWLDS